MSKRGIVSINDLVCKLQEIEDQEMPIRYADYSDHPNATGWYYLPLGTIEIVTDSKGKKFCAIKGAL